MTEIDGIGKFYTTAEVAEFLNVSTYSIMRYYRAGKLKGRKVGRTVLFLDSSLKEFLAGEDKTPKEAEGKK